MSFIAINPSESKLIKRKSLGHGKFRPCVGARAVWDMQDWGSCIGTCMCVRENGAAKSYPFAQYFSACPENNMKQRPSKHCFHTKGHRSEANFWLSLENKSSKRFLLAISSPSMVWSLTSYGKNWVVLSQRLMASPGNLLLHLQLSVSFFGYRQVSCTADLEFLSLPLTMS